VKTMEMEIVQVKGWGADADPRNRPGVPEETTPPHPMGNPPWIEPEQQCSGPVAVQGSLRKLTPVYGTSLPPRGLSGLLRRLAYHIPEYYPRRWMLLLLADRVDVIERSRIPLAVLVGWVALRVLRSRTMRRRRRFRLPGCSFARR
jgi:hypothetical protein